MDLAAIQALMASQQTHMDNLAAQNTALMARSRQLPCPGPSCCAHLAANLAYLRLTCGLTLPSLDSRSAERY